MVAKSCRSIPTSNWSFGAGAGFFSVVFGPAIEGVVLVVVVDEVEPPVERRPDWPQRTPAEAMTIAITSSGLVLIIRARILSLLRSTNTKITGTRGPI